MPSPDIGGPAAYSGGVISIGIRLVVTEPRIAAAGFFAGSFVPAVTFDEARRVAIPLHVLLQWDDEGNDRQRALELFDAFGSKEKTLYANMGGHTGVPQFAGEDAARFFARHTAPALTRASPQPKALPAHAVSCGASRCHREKRLPSPDSRACPRSIHSRSPHGGSTSSALGSRAASDSEVARVW